MFPLDFENKGNRRAPPASKDQFKAALVSFQTYGYGLGSVESKGILDLKVPHTSQQINKGEIQGFNSNWRNNPPPLLPDPLRKSQNHSDGKLNDRPSQRPEGRERCKKIELNHNSMSPAHKYLKLWYGPPHYKKDSPTKHHATKRSMSMTRKYQIKTDFESSNYLTQKPAMVYHYYTIGDYSNAANKYETFLRRRSW
ncbi:hypothetical protein PGTUg99_033718 [Puccinia graminis f. sp. tritici]|uniref:Uncharacterized protein n=1 Tax=Puccinia graminis f. sp. tritici TaxID=56615 RepID=A0A5B0LV75_PUCGR|nr:hypothetical protein PGTUg99_033718 [Puccinia graminis f. sp. tritici]